MATVELLYGTSGQAITITLSGLVTASARAGSVVTNTSTLYLDALVQVTLSTNSAVSNNGIVNVYAYGTADGGTSYGEGLAGTDVGVTLTSPTNLKLIGTMNCVANSKTYISNPMSVAAAFGGILPDHWGIVVENKTGGTFQTTAGNFAVKYQGIQQQVV